MHTLIAATRKLTIDLYITILYCIILYYIILYYISLFFLNGNLIMCLCAINIGYFYFEFFSRKQNIGRMSSPQQQRTPPPEYKPQEREPPENEPPEHEPPEHKPPEYTPPENAAPERELPTAQPAPSLHTTQTQLPVASPNPSDPPPLQPPPKPHVIVVQAASSCYKENYAASKSRALGVIQIIGGILAIIFQGVLMRLGSSSAHMAAGFYCGLFVSIFVVC